MKIKRKIAAVWATWIERRSKRFSRFRLYSCLEEAVRRHVQCSGEALTLNIGAGGEVENTLRRLGVILTSIDIDPVRKPDLVMDVERMGVLANSSVRAVFMLEVLEHVRHPHRAVAELQRVLCSGGVVIGSTPFLLGIHDAPHDYYRYTRYGLMHLFSKFECVDLVERGGYFQSIGTLCMRWLKHQADTRSYGMIFAAPLLLPIAYLFAGLDRLFPDTRATTGYFFVFRKH